MATDVRSFQCDRAIAERSWRWEGHEADEKPADKLMDGFVIRVCEMRDHYTGMHLGRLVG